MLSEVPGTILPLRSPVSLSNIIVAELVMRQKTFEELR
jgi:hypothetical protein